MQEGHSRKGRIQFAVMQAFPPQITFSKVMVNGVWPNDLLPSPKIITRLKIVAKRMFFLFIIFVFKFL